MSWDTSIYVVSEYLDVCLESMSWVINSVLRDTHICRDILINVLRYQRICREGVSWSMSWVYVLRESKFIIFHFKSVHPLGRKFWIVGGRPEGGRGCWCVAPIQAFFYAHFAFHPNLFPSPLCPRPNIFFKPLLPPRKRFFKPLLPPSQTFF